MRRAGTAVQTNNNNKSKKLTSEIKISIDHENTYKIENSLILLLLFLEGHRY